ncbi:hypothetical protein VTN00DRAFT_9942 [Thermoascus crustaceus]|uniref:uncharacterized protein n=1 Tax=Thermoascus crustaceus TaxID=5088 RepID=UPI0037442B17
MPSLPPEEHTSGDSMAAGNESSRSDESLLPEPSTASNTETDDAGQQDTTGLASTPTNMPEIQENALDIPPINVGSQGEGQPVAPPDNQAAGRLLSVDSRLRETIEDRRAQANSKGKLAMARLRLQARATNGISRPSGSSPENQIVPHEEPTDPESIDWNEAEAGLEEEGSEEFKKAEREYKSIRNPTMEDKIRFEIAKRNSVDNQLFCSEDEGDSASHKRPRDENGYDQSGNHDSSTPNQADDRNQPSIKRRRQNRTSAQEKRDSIKVGLELVVARANKATTVQRGRRTPTRRARPGGRKKSKANQLNLETLFSSDVIREAHETSKPPIPGFTEQNNEKALFEQIASIPAADQDEAKSDKNAVIQASRKFTNRVKTFGDSLYGISLFLDIFENSLH